MRIQENSIHTFILWSSFGVSILDSQKCQEGNFFHFWSISLFFRTQVSGTFLNIFEFFFQFSIKSPEFWKLELLGGFVSEVFLVGFSDFLAFFRLQDIFIKCWNKSKMQINIFIPPSADSSFPTARVALLISLSLLQTKFVLVGMKLFSYKIIKIKKLFFESFLFHWNSSNW